MNSFNDVSIRTILNIKDYVKIPSQNINKKSNEQLLSKITYFYIDDYTVCIGFLINTINGDITIPVIGMEHIRLKNNLRNDLLEFIPRLKKKRKLNAYIFLIRYCNLPIEMIDMIMLYY
jgi:hypothetical protein